MSYSAKILADSITDNGCRLSTIQVTFPRFILAEFNTHRALSKCSASSRAIPVKKVLEQVKTNPFVPAHWGKQQPGMQAKEEIENKEEARETWLIARDSACFVAEEMLQLGLHKQVVNRVLEPFVWHTVIATATEWSNFFALRCHPDAQPEMRLTADMMRFVYEQSIPEYLQPGKWHLPLVPDLPELVEEGYSIVDIVRISAGRVCRVSYLNHDGVRNPAKDLELCARLLKDFHMTPTEHQARAQRGLDPAPSGNFVGWDQFRKMIPNEDDFSKVRRETV